MRLSDDEVRGAWSKLFSTPEGKIAFKSLHHVALEVIHGDSSALQEHNGRRRFAADLMAMAMMEPTSNEPERKQRAESGRQSKRHGPAGRG